MKARINHSVVPVHKGMMQFALDLFALIGFYKIEYEAHWDGGYAYFVADSEGQRLQLTEDLTQNDVRFEPGSALECDSRALRTVEVIEKMLPWVHVAIECDVTEMQQKIAKWVAELRLSPVRNVVIEFEAAPGGKLFVTLPQIIWIDLELVPQTL